MKNVKFWGTLVRYHEEVVALIFLILKKKKKEREPFTPKSSIVQNKQTNHSERGHTPSNGPMLMLSSVLSALPQKEGRI
jgi:hypothetical protein